MKLRGNCLITRWAAATAFAAMSLAGTPWAHAGSVYATAVGFPESKLVAVGVCTVEAIGSVLTTVELCELREGGIPSSSLGTEVEQPGPVAVAVVEGYGYGYGYDEVCVAGSAKFIGYTETYSTRCFPVE